MTEPEKRLTPAPSAMAVEVARAMLFERSAGYVGQAKLAAALGIQERSLRAKFSSDRGISDVDLEQAAYAVETRAFEMMAHARKLRAMIA